MPGVSSAGNRVSRHYLDYRSFVAPKVARTSRHTSNRREIVAEIFLPPARQRASSATRNHWVG